MKDRTDDESKGNQPVKTLINDNPKQGPQQHGNFIVNNPAKSSQEEILAAFKLHALLEEKLPIYFRTTFFSSCTMSSTKKEKQDALVMIKFPSALFRIAWEKSTLFPIGLYSKHHHNAFCFRTMFIEESFYEKVTEDFSTINKVDIEKNIQELLFQTVLENINSPLKALQSINEELVEAHAQPVSDTQIQNEKNELSRQNISSLVDYMWRVNATLMLAERKLDVAVPRFFKPVNQSGMFASSSERTKVITENSASSLKNSAHEKSRPGAP